MEALLQEKLQQTGDLDLALLVSLVAEEHCLFAGPLQSSQDLREELRLTCSATFGLRAAFVDCTSQTTVDEFCERTLVDVVDEFDDTPGAHDSANKGQPSRRIVDHHSSRSGSQERVGNLSNQLDERRIADVVIATNLDQASTDVQIQTLELLRTKRVFTRSAMHTAPKDFLFVGLLSKPEARLVHHLNDMFAISHVHAEEDGLPHLKGSTTNLDLPFFFPEDITALRQRAEGVFLDPEVAQYLHQVVVFARTNRLIRGGVTATATRNLRTVAQALAALHGLDYVPPSLIALAARKVYPHRLILATAQTERSLQWGSDPEAVKQLLEGITVADAIEDVLASIETPL